jgi:hypothetical protein
MDSTQFRNIITFIRSDNLHTYGKATGHVRELKEETTVDFRHH